MRPHLLDSGVLALLWGNMQLIEALSKNAVSTQRRASYLPDCSSLAGPVCGVGQEDSMTVPVPFVWCC